MVSRFAGLQALLCALIGIETGIGTGALGYPQVSVVAGLLVSITLIFVVLGCACITSALVRGIIGALTTLHLLIAVWLYPYQNFKPMMLSPFLLLEVVGLLYAVDRVKKPG